MNFIVIKTPPVAVVLINALIIECTGFLSPHDKSLGPVRNNLSCIHCSTLTSGDKCVNLPNITSEYPSRSCVGEESSCTVRRLSYFVRNSNATRLWSLERNCTKKCVNDCFVTSDVKLKLYFCTSCCHDKNLCNTDNQALSLRSYRTFVYLLLALPLISRIFQFS